MRSFELDPFQKEAIRWIEEEHSVLVAAPTGAGKTVIAEYATDKAMERHEGVIYTAPIKALSNQKYRDFRARYGDDKVGILTGDVSINPDAPIVIMTTEIYRNALFDPTDRIKRVGWVIFDEIHYLDDPERGTVWEEALLFTPPEIRILALSATVPNVRELADWIRQVHDRPIAVVEENHRPVPLQFYYQCQGRIYENPKRLRAEGYANRDSWQVSNRDRRRGIRMPRPRMNRLEEILEHLISQKRLPAIYFAFGRKKAESLAWEAAAYDFLTEEERKENLTFYGGLVEKYDLKNEKSAIELEELVSRGIAFHHAGMLPSLKEVVEQLFTDKRIKLIFTTETFALGINMPARCVVFDELEKFYGHGFKTLTTRDFYQMAGRAGRRGMDTQGFVLIRLDPRDTPFPEVQRVIHGKPEMVRSQLNAAYATLLNLYRHLGESLLDIYPRTFHHYQSSAKGRDEGVNLLKSKLHLLKEMGYIVEGGLTTKGEFAACLFGHELILAEMQGQGFLDHLDEAGLAALLSSLVFEPRGKDEAPRLTGRHEKMRKQAEEFYRTIHKLEFKYRVRPFTKMPYLHIAAAAEAWARGATFDKLFELANADEGEMVRYFRMIVQLLRELMNAPHTSEKLRATAARTWDAINRGVVDAEKQLRS